jgi:hypothetical protein
MNDDDFKDINDFFQYISNVFSTRNGNKRRINRTKSKGFRNENLNTRRGRCTTDLIKDKSTSEVVGFNKKKNKFDTADRFNPLYFIDEP